MRCSGFRISTIEAQRLGGWFLQLEDNLSLRRAGCDRFNRQRLIAVVGDQESQLSRIDFILKSDYQRTPWLAEAPGQFTGGDKAYVLRIINCLNLERTREGIIRNLEREPVARNSRTKIDYPRRSGRTRNS